jgi:aarF domain-containing kinase
MLLLDNFVHSDLHPGNIMVKLSRPTTSLLLKTLWTRFTGDVENLANDPTNLESNAVVFRAQISFVFPHRTSFRCLHNEGYLPDLVFIDEPCHDVECEESAENFRAIAEFDGYRAG